MDELERNGAVEFEHMAGRIRVVLLEKCRFATFHGRMYDFKKADIPGGIEHPVAVSSLLYESHKGWSENDRWEASWGVVDYDFIKPILALMDPVRLKDMDKEDGRQAMEALKQLTNKEVTVGDMFKAVETIPPVTDISTDDLMF